METEALNRLDLRGWLLQVLEDHRDQIIKEFRAQKLASTCVHGRAIPSSAECISESELSKQQALNIECKKMTEGAARALAELPKPGFVRPLSLATDCQVPLPWPGDLNEDRSTLTKASVSCPLSPLLIVHGATYHGPTHRHTDGVASHDATHEASISNYASNESYPAMHAESTSHHVRLCQSVVKYGEDEQASIGLIDDNHGVTYCREAVERKFHWCHTTSELFKETYSKSGWKHSRKHMKSRITELSSEAEHKMAEYISQNLFQRQPRQLQMFDSVVGVLIILNAVTMFAQLQWEGHTTAISLGQASDDGSWQHAELSFKVLEHVFNAVFFFELVIRFVIQRRKYFEEISNIGDFILVVVSSANLYIIEPFFAKDSTLSIVQVLRLGRTIRVLRVIRVFKLFQELRILVSTFLSSLLALVWAMVFLFVVILVAALFVSFSTQDFMRDEANDHGTKVSLYRHYGNGFHAMYALFEATMSGCWPNYFRPLIDKVSVWYVVFVCFYVSLVIFALTRVITAMFLKETLRVSQADAETQAAEQFKKKHMYIDKLRETFMAIDVSGDGRLNYSEFRRMCTNPEVQVIMRMLELDIEDADAVFTMLDTQQAGEISFEDFLKGVMRLKGQARSLDIIAVMITADAMHVALDDMHTRVYKMEKLLKILVEEHFEPTASTNNAMKTGRAISMWK